MFFFVEQVMDAEKQKADSGAFHHEKTVVFNAAELKVKLLIINFLMFNWI